MLPVDQQLSSILERRIRENRQKLISIVETVIFCGRQGIALRGHRDDQIHLEEAPSANHGNFQALLHFRVQSGDKVLAEHLNSAGQHQNALYTSKTIQNELIDVCGHIIRTIILKEVHDAHLFSDMADEATDAANEEQLSISLRYVKQNTRTIQERFLAFSECVTGVSGEAIADHILQHHADWQLPATHLCGQTYDGAGAMAGKKKGAATRITQLFPKALYTHWVAHALNLCVVKCCSIADIRNIMDTGDSICRFFANSPKRQLALEKWVGQVIEGEHRRRLKSLCKTRWVERHEAFEVFVDLFEPLVCCLEDIKDSNEWNRETRADASSYFLALSRFPFIIALVITKEILAYTKALSIKLQGRYVDVVRAYKEVNFVKSTLKSAREDVDGFHTHIYRKALQIAGKVQVNESLPRTTGRQLQRSNIPYATATQYYQRVLTIPMLDYLITGMNERFNDSSSAVICQIMLMLPSTLSECEDVLTSADIPDLVNMYNDNLPAPSALDMELHCWSVKWRGRIEEAAAQNTPAKVLVTIDGNFFPNIEQLLKIACTLPVTSVECERSISRLRHHKTYLRSTMQEARLNGLAMMYIHRDIHCDATAVVDEFARRHPRRLQLINPFCTTDDQ